MPDDITCRELVELITEYLEDRLSDSDALRFTQHLEICGDCRTYLDQMRTVATTSASIEPDALDPQVRDSLLDRFRDWKRGTEHL